ncbi:MAG: cyclase family protein [Dehalococcoidales bacterium]|nr:cyclase family protein [Dehalococcoidales bacterium]
MAEWIDITLPLGKEIPVLPIGDPDNPAVPIPKVERFFDVEKGDVATMSRIEMISHDGTHIDAPLHFIRGGKTIDEMPVDTTIGPARVIEIKDEKDITVKELEQYDIKSGERILFKTRNSPVVYSSQWYTGPHVTLSLEGAKYLADKKIRLVGIDYLSIASNDPPELLGEVHITLLSNGVFIIEGLNLDGVKPGDYELVCLPLRLEKGDAGPCRAVIRPL